jgi:gliding motility-associated-like protein
MTNIDEGHITFQPNASGYYTATIQDNYGCISSDSIYIIVNETPIGPFDSISFCIGTEYFIYNNTPNFLRYTWLNNQSNLSDSNVPNPKILDEIGGPYFVDISNGICSIKDTLNVSFTDKLEITGLNSVLDVCIDDKLIVMLNGAPNYIWSSNSDFTCLNSSCSQVEIQAMNGQNLYTIYTDIEDEACNDTLVFILNGVSGTILKEELKEICNGDSIKIKNVWYKSNTTICDTLSGGSKCLNIHCTKLMVNPSPNIIDLIDTFNLNGQNTISIDLNSTYNTIEVLPGPIATCKNCSSITIQNAEVGTYTIEVSNSLNCRTSEPITIINDLDCLESLQIPNAFTPGNNGLNDVFRIVGLAANNSNVKTFRIYNEWGQLLYDRTDNQGWDGKFKNEYVPSGVYLYVIEVDCLAGEKTLLKGDVTVIR